MAAVVVDFDCVLNHALQCLGCPNLTLKPEAEGVIEICIQGEGLVRMALLLLTGFG